jgi:hypothetical protein
MKYKPLLYVSASLLKKNDPLIQVAMMVAAIVAVSKSWLPTAYSLTVLIPLLDSKPTTTVATKNPIKMAESVLKFISFNLIYI